MLVGFAPEKVFFTTKETLIFFLFLQESVLLVLIRSVSVWRFSSTQNMFLWTNKKNIVDNQSYLEQQSNVGIGLGTVITSLHVYAS